jgi:hypothetical protein
MVLQEKLRGTKMTKTDSVTSYLTRFSQIHDELGAVGEIVVPSVLVRTTLNGFSKPWESFVRGIMAREHMPSWERLWDDLYWKSFDFSQDPYELVRITLNGFSKPWESFV